MNDFKQRLEIERAELAEKLSKLSAFNQGEKVKEIDPIQKSLLSIQESAMTTYYKCLEERLIRL